MCPSTWRSWQGVCVHRGAQGWAAKPAEVAAGWVEDVRCHSQCSRIQQGLCPHLSSRPPWLRRTRLVMCVEGKTGAAQLLGMLQQAVAANSQLLWQEQMERQQRVGGRVCLGGGDGVLGCVGSVICALGLRGSGREQLEREQKAGGWEGAGNLEGIAEWQQQRWAGEVRTTCMHAPPALLWFSGSLV